MQQLRIAVCYLSYSMQNATNTKKDAVCVVGLGYVGLTLAVVFAEEGFPVIGVDANEGLIKELRKGNPHFHEPGLAERMKELGAKISYVTAIPKTDARTNYVIAVGTNMDDAHRPDYRHVTSASIAIASHLKKGDLVVLRSTVTLGATREIALPLLEKGSGFVAGVDFHLAFAPERTIEGKALHELRTLPQVVGGYTDACAEAAKELFLHITKDVVVAGTLEEAEMVKLMSNAYRDLSFGFANNLALVASGHNIDINRAIHAANHGYERNRIPLPSPGVGGYCLTKDPHLLAHSSRHKDDIGALFREGRKANLRMPAHTADIIEAFFKHAKKKTGRIVVLGLAFKGHPATSDIRFSPSHDLVKELQARGHTELFGYDPHVIKDVFEDWKLTPIDSIEEAAKEGDVLVFMHMNDHYKDFAHKEQSQEEPHLVVDPWGIYDKEQLMEKGWKYANLGYRSF